MAVSGDKPFDQRLCAFFGADKGAYSIVTPTEADDGQVTLTGEEKKLALNYFGEAELSEYRGNDEVLASKGLDARRAFRHFTTGQVVYPKLKYAKSKGTELRLYFNAEEFKVTEGEFWGIFTKKGEIWICNFSQKLFGALKNDELQFDDRHLLEAEIDDFQSEANSAAPEQMESHSMQWKRDPKIAAGALKSKNYECEIHPEFPTFVSRATGNPFMEAHHLVPMKLQTVYKDAINLDTIENICVLNPLSHRMLHHGKFDDIVDSLNILVKTRLDFIRSLDLVSDDIFAMYG